MENTKHARIAKGIEVAANIGLVIVALLAVGFFVKGQFARSPEPHQIIPIGSKVEIQNVDWRTSPQKPWFWPFLPRVISVQRAPHFTANLPSMRKTCRTSERSRHSASRSLSRMPPHD